MAINRIAIIGGGLASWMAASALARVLGPMQCAIQIISNSGIDRSMGPFVPALTTLPTARQFHAQFGYNEDEIIAKTAGCFSLGNAISGWAQTGTACFHPFGDTGAAMGHVSFHNLAARLRADGDAINLPDYSIAALCAQTNRFIRPPDNDASAVSTLDYGLVLDSAAYTEFFRHDAKARGVAEGVGDIQQVAINDAGLIDSITLTNGEEVKADLFLDCTGDAVRLIGAMRDIIFHDWSHWLPCDHISSSKASTANAPAPYAYSVAKANGWGRFAATRSHECESNITSGSNTAESEAFKNGHRSAFWADNCIALGAAAAIVDPLSPLSLHLLQSSIRRMIQLFPNEPQSPVEARNYNQQCMEELEGARDWVILPYKINGRAGDPFWDQCRTMPVPDRLDHRIELYKATGRVALYDGDIMEEADWVVMFDALGIYPRRYDPAANGIPVHAIRDHFGRIREVMLREVAQIPFHHDYLRGIAQ